MKGSPAAVAGDLFATVRIQHTADLKTREWASSVPDRDGFLSRGAVFDPTEVFRYVLWRRWAPLGPRVLWLLLNPSTADETEGGLDPTLRRCTSFSRRWGFAEMRVSNIFALRSTDPQALYSSPDPVGPHNDATIRAEVAAADLVVVGWGAHGRFRGRAEAVLAALRGHDVRCLALTKSGEPGHPLYLRDSVVPAQYRW